MADVTVTRVPMESGGEKTEDLNIAGLNPNDGFDMDPRKPSGWNWNFSIPNQAVHDHAMLLLVDIAKGVRVIEDSASRVTLLHCLIETAKRIIEREENTI